MAHRKPDKVSRDRDRVSPFSNTPGGVTIRVVKRDGLTIDYPRVKYPNNFIKKVLEDNKNQDAYIVE